MLILFAQRHMKLVAAPRMPRFWKDSKRILDFPMQ